MGFYKEKLFPWVLDNTEPKEMGDHRRRLLSDVNGTVLEIGLGTGANLPFYPKGVKELTAVEPSATMRPRAEKRAREAGIHIEWYNVAGEYLPFGDNTFDSVVVTDVLCTVSNVDKVLSEAYRVLKVGGRLYLLEHGLSRDKKIRKWQIRLNNLSRAVACGCELTRDIEESLRKSAFQFEELELLAPFSGFNALYTHIKGTAAKTKGE